MIKKRRKSRIYKNKEKNKPYISVMLLNYKILHYSELLLKPERERDKDRDFVVGIEG